MEIYSVNQINKIIKRLVESSESLQDVWVKGEISNFRHYNKKHMYFSLKDENSLIKCVVFSRVNENLDFVPKEGMSVLINGNVEVYKRKGVYQIIVEDMRLAGEGELYKKFLELKNRLSKEGLFKKKRDIPRFPKTIGVVTSPEGAAIRDILHIIKRRYPHINLLIYPSLVQGDEAKKSICRGIDVLNKLDVDVIIISRGGGSIEDLWSFNEECVARKIYSSKIPVISGVGHETDVTISDFVADKRVPTPSGAAEIVVENKIKIKERVSDLGGRLKKDIKWILEDKKQKLNYYLSRVIFRKPLKLIEEYKQVLDEKDSRAEELMKNKMSLLKEKIENRQGRLNALNPYSILNRGYSLTMKEGRVVGAKDINKRDVIYTIFNDGGVKSEVI